MATEKLFEYAASRGPLKIDREKGVIHGVKILGLESKNGRSYPKETAARALPLYEGAKVNINHTGGAGPRDYQDRIGIIRNPVLGRADEGVYADFHFNPKHAMAEQLLWDAEHSPENVGFSHVIEGKTARKAGRVVVEEIQQVLSVDLVADPATTRGLFEGEISNKIADDAKQAALRKINSTANDLISRVMWGEDGENMTVAQKKKRILAVLADWEAELTALSPASDTTQGVVNVEWKEITVEELQKQRPDLIQNVKESKDQAAELKALREEIDRYKAAEALAGQKAAIEKELAEAKLPEALVTETFRATLLETADAAKRKALIEDRQTLAKIVPAAPVKPVCKEQRVPVRGSDAPITEADVPDADAFVRRLIG